MKHILRQVFHSGKFVVGFSIFMAILLIVLIYPLIITDPPLAIIGQGTFRKAKGRSLVPAFRYPSRLPAWQRPDRTADTQNRFENST